MRKALAIIVASLFTVPVGAQTVAPVCHPAAPPTKPVNSEDFNPGFGANTGLNDDFHDDIVDPLDRPGGLISDLARQLAQDGEPGGVHLLRDFVGADCARN